jgi:hypothetical protein
LVRVSCLYQTAAGVNGGATMRRAGEASANDEFGAASRRVLALGPG